MPKNGCNRKLFASVVLMACAILATAKANAGPIKPISDLCYAEAKIISALDEDSGMYAEGASPCLAESGAVITEVALAPASTVDHPTLIINAFDDGSDQLQIVQVRAGRGSGGRGGGYRGGGAYRGAGVRTGAYRGGAVYRGGAYRRGAVVGGAVVGGG